MEATQFWTGKRILEETLKHVAPLPSQKEYARALASIFAMHIHRNTLIDDGFAADELPAPSAIVVAPTGQGKTFLIRKMAECLDLNVITVDCSTLVPEGYKGASLSERLLEAMGTAKSQESFERSILFLDEIDKTLGRGEVNAMSNILQLFNDGSVAISPKFGKAVSARTSRFTVLMGGAFVGLETIIQERVCPRPKMGFSTSGSGEKLTKGQLMQQATTEDLAKYGIMPELLGRVGTVLSIPPLEVEDYRQLLNAESGSLRRKYSNYLQNIYGVNFEISSAGVEAVAQQCMKAETGARAVNPIVNDMMREATAAVEVDDGICKVILDANEDVCCIYYEYGPRQYSYRSQICACAQKELPTLTVEAPSVDELTVKLCRYYQHGGGDLRHLPLLNAFLGCTLRFLFERTKPSEFTFESLEKMARATERVHEKSPFDIIMGDAHYERTQAYQSFNHYYDSWTQKNLLYALQVIMARIQEHRGPCRVKFEVPRNNRK